MFRFVFAVLLCLCTMSLTQAQSARMSARITDSSGSTISAAAVGDNVFLQLLVEDLRDDPTGIFSAYANIHFDPEFVAVSGSIDHGFTYTQLTKPRGGLVLDGLIETAGGLGPIHPTGGGEFEVLNVPFEVIKLGSTEFLLSAPANQRQDGMFPYLEPDVLDPSDIEFVGAILTVPEPQFSMPTLLLLLAWGRNMQRRRQRRDDT